MLEQGSQTTNPKTRQLETAMRADHNPLFTKFWQELRAGKGTEKGEVDVEELVAFYTNVEPLSPLTKEETEKVREYLRRRFRSNIYNYNRVYNTFINNEMLLVETSKDPDLRVFINSVGTYMHQYTLLSMSDLSEEKNYREIIKSLLAKGFKSLTTEEKVKLFSDPEFFKQTQYYVRDLKSRKMRMTGFGSGSQRLTGKGGYYKSNEEFLQEVQTIKGQTSKSTLRVLDVGSNFGLALKDMCDLVPNIETFNMTIDEHPSLFGDHIVHHPAEMMPAEFEETMDLIESKMAFRYFLYSDIALRNVIKSLSVGGVARIFYSVGDPVNLGIFDFSLDKQERKDRQKNLWVDIKVLVDEGYLDMTGSSSVIKEGVLIPNRQADVEFIRLTKNKSIRSIKF